MFEQDLFYRGELFSRIRNLEAQLAHGQPPQPWRVRELGKRECRMRNTFDYSNIRNYRSALNLVEIFDLTIMELRAHLRNPLCTLLLIDPDARLAQILSQSPFDVRNIRSEVDDFIEVLHAFIFKSFC